MTKSKRFFFVMLGIFLLTVIGSAGVFYIYNQQLSDLNQDIGRLKADEQLLDERLGEFEDRKAQIEALGFVNDLVESALPVTKEQGVVLAEIKKFITDAELTFVSVTFQGAGSQSLLVAGLSQTEVPVGLSGVRVLPVEATIGAGATYGQVIEVLESIENNRRRMQVTSLDLTPSNEGFDGFSDITIALDVYVQAGATVEPAESSDDSTETGGGVES